MSTNLNFGASTWKFAQDSVLFSFDGLVAFDAYSATTCELTPEDMADIVMVGDDTIERGLYGHHQFEKRDVITDNGGNSVATVYYGGKTHGGRVMLDVKGHRTPDAVTSLRKVAPSHRCTRVDSRMDFDCPGVFEKLLSPMMEIVDRKKLYSKPDGDWRNHPELGRTQYAGSPKSAVRVRLYEKGKEPSQRYLCRADWTRLEIQIRPKDIAREIFAKASPIDAWGAAEWTRELAGKILEQKILPLKAEAVKLPSVDEAKLRWMCKQYGAPLVSLLHHHQGDLEAFGLSISRVLGEVQQEDRYLKSRKGP